MAHVGVERFTAGDDEEDRTEGQEAIQVVRRDHLQGVEGVERLEHDRVVENLDETEQADDREPDDHDRPEHLADARGTAALHREQTDDDDDRDDVDVRDNIKSTDIRPEIKVDTPASYNKKKVAYHQESEINVDDI